MAMTDPLGDMLTRIRNGQQARKDSILTPASNLRVRVLDVLQREGYIRGYSEEELAGQKGIRIELKYFEGQPAIQHLARVSKPGRRVYSAARELPRIRNGLGTIIVSTPRGGASPRPAAASCRRRGTSRPPATPAPGSSGPPGGGCSRAGRREKPVGAAKPWGGFFVVPL